MKTAVLLLLWTCGCLMRLGNSQTFHFQNTGGISVNEEQPVGAVVVDVDVTYVDPVFDIFDDQYGSYSFVNGQDEQSFAIGASDGVITFADVLDVDGPSPKILYYLEVEFSASDGYSDVTSFTVQLQDINDNAPAFNQTQYLVTLPENSAVDFQVYQVRADDPDQVATVQVIDEVTETVTGIIYTVTNGRVLYSILGGNKDGQFKINNETGSITVAVGSSIDYDENDFYNLTILAEDGGGLNTTAQVLITILDSNDNAPVIEYPDDFTIDLPEDTPPGLVIIDYINATDDDHGTNQDILFTIISGDITNSFSVDKLTGMVNLTGELDRETGNPQILTIAAIDQGQPQLQDTLVITVNILDINDEAPEFQESPYNFEVSENSKVGTVVGTVVAIDNDEGDGGVVTYYLADVSEYFDIDNITGAIFTSNPNLDRETQSYHELTVIAVDNPINKSLALNTSVVVNITLLDQNDNSPQWSEPLYSVGILETETAGYILTTLQATDADAGSNGQLKYEFFNSNDITFSIDADSGEVTLAGDLDFSTQNSYIYTVRAYDGAPLPQSNFATLNITVHTPNKKPPVFAILTQNLTLSEETAVDTVVLNVTATDKDSGIIGLVRYRISTDSIFDGSGSFDVVEDTGAVFISEKLDFDYKKDKSIFFQVEAYDGGFPEPFTAHTNITVYLTNTNDEAPKIIIPIENTPIIIENMPPNTEFADLKNFTIDEDPGDGGLFEFSLVEIYGDDYGNDSFEVTENGTLVALRTFDREEQPNGFILSIETTDLGITISNSLVTNVTVLIGDVNDETPFFESNDSAIVYEFLPPGELIIENFTAIDYDIGKNAELIYDIVDGDTTDSFTINSNGKITTTKPLNKTEERYYILTIRAIDQGSPPLHDYGELYVEVIDYNDNAPLFDEPLIASFYENDSPDTVFYTLNATDLDEGTNSEIVYYLSDDSISNLTRFDNETNTTIVRFSVDELSGDVAIQDTFDRETENVFYLSVVAVDLGMVPGMLNTTVILTVLVEDVNDHVPVFLNDSYTFYVNENEDIGELVGQVIARDNDATDPNNELIYVLDSLWGDDNVTVNETSGELFVNGTIDWEETSVIDIVVYVFDQGVPQLTSSVNITVLIEDVNDNAPEWTVLNLTIYENLPPYSFAGFIKAIDIDSVGNNSIVYYLQETNLTSEYFYVNQTTGEVTSLDSFDREAMDIYELNMIAYDSGIPQMKMAATVRIEILDENDHNPYFLQSEYVATISENTPNQTVILTVQAKDNDIGSNALLSYAIYSLEYSYYFTVNETNGELSTNAILDYETRIYFEFEVTVMDNGEPQRNATTIVKITLTNYNDEVPIFSQQEYDITLVENIPIGSNILHIQSDDVDSTVTTYSIEESFASTFFEIDPIIGMLYTVGFINREVLGTNIQLVIVANNSAEEINPLSSSAIVHITIPDLNDQAPLLDPYITVQVSEDTLNGSIIYTVIAEDGDEGLNGTIVYEITRGNEGDLFSINGTTGDLYLTGLLNYDQHMYYYIGVNATDQGVDPLYGYTTIVIQVTDSNNHKPLFAASTYNTTIQFTTIVGATVITPLAYDKDSIDTIEYSIVGGNDYDLFQMSANNGLISVKNSLTTYPDEIVSLTVQASDGQYSDTAVVNIHIRGFSTNSLYFSSSSYSESVVEGYSGSDVLIGFYDQVNGATPTTEFHIAEGNNDGIFTMSNDGDLTVDGSKLNFESKSLYQLSISVDSVSYAVVNIEIEDENEFVPIFSSTMFYAPVSETTKTSDSFFVILAEDEDGSSPSNKITYSISSGNENGIFSINKNNGRLSLSKRLDFDINEHVYVLNISAQNKDSSPALTSWQLVTVEILNGNRYPPVFSSPIYATTISEDLIQRSSIGITVDAIDMDENQLSKVTYTLLGDHRHYDFEIDSDNGSITVGPGGIDFERKELYVLIAIASDDEVPTMTSTALVIVTIVDINDNSPSWEQAQYSANIYENVSPGTTIATVLATDADQIDYTYDSINDVLTFENTNGHVVYSITNGNPKSQFNITQDTFNMNMPNVPATVAIAAPLNREDISEYNLTITATDGGGRSTDAYLYVSLIDENDFTPTFSQTMFYVDISEDLEVDSLVAHIPAIDEDYKHNSHLTYNITGGNVNETFLINTTTAEVFLVKELNREVLSSYVLTIEATDNGTVPLIGYTSLHIKVLDVNEFAPQFKKLNFSAAVSEDIAYDEIIVKIEATDKDSGVNSEIVYSITNSTVNDQFKINSTSGEITINSELDYELYQVHYLIVTASDSAPIAKQLSTTVEVTIIVFDVNDNVPEFNQDHYEASIFEDAEPFSDVLEVNAVDIDSDLNAEIIYSLEFNGDSNAASTFFIDAMTGEINVTNSSVLDYEKRVNYTFGVIATDQGIPPLSSTSSITVLVEDVNDNSPSFTKSVYTGSLMENLASGQHVLIVNSTDIDSAENGEVKYSIVEIITAKNVCLSFCPTLIDKCETGFNTNYSSDSNFEIDMLTGVLTTVGSFDRELQNEYIIVLMATDSSIDDDRLTDTACAVIEILDANDETPVFDNPPYTASVSEGLPSGEFLLNVSAVDADIGNNGIVSYSLNDHSDTFTVNPTLGAIYTLATLDRELVDSYNVTVTATDGGLSSNTATTTVYIEVIDTNDSPPLFEYLQYNTTVSEVTAIDSVVFTAFATDSDIGPNGVIRYSLVSILPETRFEINETTGDVYLTEPLDREQYSEYTLTILATDNGTIPLSSSAILSIVVEDFNDNPPVFSQNVYFTTVIEELVPSAPIVIVNALDIDEIGNNSIVLFSLVNSSSTFSINETSGEIYLQEKLNAEDELAVNITVIAQNEYASPQLYSSTVVTIEISDINDHSPVFSSSQYSVVILESSPVDSPVLQLTATDDDVTFENRNLSYFIVNTTGSDNFGIGQKNGQIFVAKVLDSDMYPMEYTFSVYVEDNGGFSGNTSVTVFLTNVNDNPPIFVEDEYNFSLSENEPVGSSIGIVLAVDADEQNVTYFIADDSAYHNRFTIDSQTGQILSNFIFNREIQDLYTFNVTAVDDLFNGTYIDTTVQVTILDVNDNRPVFEKESYTISTAENTPVDTLLITVTANDDDLNSNAIPLYSIESGNFSDFFYINTTTGSVYLNQLLNREEDDFIEITVVATDSLDVTLTSKAKLSIVVEDVNDNVPVFNSPLYEATLLEDADIGTIISTVSAYDNDIGSNAQISYNLTEEFQHMFSINETSGEITLATSFDYELSRNHSVTVIVSDHGQPVLQSTSELFITVVDINDNLPYFEQQLYTTSVAENSVLETSVFFVPAIDIDDGLNSKLHYTILSGNVGFYFNLNEDTGIISVADYIDYELDQSFELQVQVVDLGTPQFTATTTINILIVDKNDNTPVFFDNIFYISVPEDSTIDTDVFQLVAEDQDTGSNAEITFSIVSGNLNYAFDIDNDSGYVTVNDTLDYEEQSSYTLTIVATDNGTPRLSSMAQLIVTVTDINEEAPKLYADNYYLNISQATAVGTVLAYLKAYDTDGDSVPPMYNITSSSLFGITNLGELYVYGPLSVGIFTLGVSVSDGSNVNNVFIEIGVYPQSYTGPRFQQVTYQFNVNEGMVDLKFVGNVTIENGFESIQFLTANNEPIEMTDSFSINSLGAIYTINQLDWENEKYFVINVKATKDGNEVFSIITINVIDINDNMPLFDVEQYSVTLSERTPVDTTLLSFIVSDKDSPGINRATTLSVTEGGEYFKVDSTTGNLILIKELDRELNDSLILVVTANNSLADPALHSTAKVFVTVQDENDNSPEFEQAFYYIDVFDTTPIGEMLLAVTATDIDEGMNAELVYTLTYQSSPESFVINRTSGVIYTNKIFENEIGSELSLTVSVTDMGDPTPHSDSTFVIVTVLKENLYNPVFIQSDGYSVSIDETIAIGTSIIEITATDPDNDSVTYSIDDGVPFTISPLTGVIRVSDNVEYIKQHLYSFYVYAIDNGSPVRSATVSVNVTIVDVNNYSPVFTKNMYSVSILENIEIGTFVTKIEATDLDAVSITYTITVNYQENGVDLFRINSSSGEISTNAHINREGVDHIELLVSAIDNGYTVQRSMSTEVIIDIVDINDEHPVFSSPQYNVDVIRLSPAGYHVLNITAQDPDITSDEIVYTIVFQTVADIFKINSDSGSITTASTIPEDVQNNTLIVVSAFDGAQTLNVSVNVKFVTDGTFCQDGFCTVVVERSLDCNYVIPDFPICETFCETDSILSPKDWLCIKYNCLNDILVPCPSQSECLMSNVACSDTCPVGESLCPPTNLCYSDSTTTPCDTNTCLIGQTLIQSEDGTRHCALSSTLSAVGEACITHGYVYCAEIDECSNLTAPHLCKYCPEGEIACNDTKVCVNDTKYCCGTNGYYCDVLNKCLLHDEVCILPNIAPNINKQLIYYGMINEVISDIKGKMIGTLVGENDELGIDNQGDEIGIAVVESNTTMGDWQYGECFGGIDICRECSNVSSWSSIENIYSEYFALYLPNTACLRFVRNSLYFTGASWLRIKAWDGNTNGYISPVSTLVRYQSPYIGSILPYSATGSVSDDSTLLSVLVFPINTYPTITEGKPELTDIVENVPLQANLGDSVNNIVNSISVDYLPVLTNNVISGLPSSDGNGNSIDYTNLLPTEAVQQFYNAIDSLNPTRSDRISSNHNPGIAVQLHSESNGDWQVSLNGDPQLYTYIKNIVENSDRLLMLSTSALIRYIPTHYFSGTATLAVYPWDGVVPEASSQHNVNSFIAHTAIRDDFDTYSINNATLLSVTVLKSDQAPVITATTVLTSPIPYAMKFDYPELFTVTTQRDYNALDMDGNEIENVLYLVLSHPVEVHRIFPSPNSNTYISFTVNDNALNFSSVQYSIDAKQSILNDILPIIKLTQDAIYGTGIDCIGSSGEVNGDYVHSLISQLASDVDGDFIGMAIIGQTPNEGAWQYSRGNWDTTYDSSGIWINLPTGLTDQSALLLYSSDKIRYIPKPNYYWTNNEAIPSLTVKAWDDSLGDVANNTILSLMDINTNPYIDTVQSIYKPLGRFSSSIATIYASRLGCDDVVNSGLKYDACCTCGGVGDGCNGCDGVVGSNMQLDSCGVCDGSDTVCLECDVVPFSFLESGSCSECISGVVTTALQDEFSSESFTDCSGTCLGSALVDDCGVCSEGTSGHEYNTDKDCFGICFGSNVIDECQYCTGPDAGISFNEYLDCTGVCGGPFRADSCGNCQLPDNEGNILEHADCHGTCYGTAQTDSCGICYGGLTDITKDSVLDQCGVCHGNDTSCYGCDGVLNSEKTVDNCGICGGNDCGCQKIMEAIPDRGPASGGTDIVIVGSGFFQNSSFYNSALPYCNTSTTSIGGKSISATCRFQSQQEEAIGNAYIVNQSAIACQTPSVSNADNDFFLSIRIEDGEYTPAIPFIFQSFTVIDIVSVTPSKGLLNYENQVKFIGSNFLDNGLQSCLVQDTLGCLNHLTFDSRGYHAVTGNFVSDNEIYCKLPIAYTACEVSLYLSFDGQESGIIQYPDPLMQTYTYSYSAPNVTSVHFSSDLTTLVINFNQSANISDQFQLSCSSLFSDETLKLVSQNALCTWGNTQHTSIHVSLPITAEVGVGSLIKFREGALVTSGELYSFAISTTSLVEASVSPIVVLEGPNVISSCGYNTFNVIGTLYEGYKPFSYKWSLYTIDSTVEGVTDVIDYLNSLPSTASTITIFSELFQPSTVYVINVNVTSGVGETTTISKELIKENVPSLQISISSPQSLSFYPDQDMLLQASVVNDDCANFQNFEFDWKLNRLIDERRSTYEQQTFADLIVDNSILYIPGGVLSPDSEYEIVVTAITSDNSQIATSIVHVTIHDTLCRAKIHGGNRTLSIGQLLLLEGSTSVESTKGSAQYMWQCAVIGSGIPCYNASISSTMIPIKLPFKSQVSFSTSNLNPGLEYMFTLTLKQGDCESTAKTVITITESLNPPPAIVEIITSSLHFQQSQVITIEGLVLANKPVTVLWECLQLDDHSHIALDSESLLSPKQYSALPEQEIGNYTNIFSIDQTSTVNLVLEPGALQGSLPYTFQLLAVYLNDIVSSRVTIHVDTPPQVHSFTVSPTTGVALNTMFKLQVGRVTESVDHYPLYYQFGLIENGVTHWLTGITSEKVLYTYLPSGSPTSVIVRVYNSYTGFSEHSYDVAVGSNSAVNFGAFVDDLRDNLLSTKNWITTLASLQSMLLSIPGNTNIEAATVNLLSNLFDDYIPFNKANSMAILSLVGSISDNLDISDSSRNTLLNIISNTLDEIDQQLNTNYNSILVAANNHLTSNRFNRSTLAEGIEFDMIAIVFKTIYLLTNNWNAELAIKEVQNRDKLHHILCKQAVLGEPVTSVGFNNFEFNFVKGITVGRMDTNDRSAFIEMDDGFLQLYESLACIDSTYVSCKEACIQLTAFTNDYFAHSSDNILTLSSNGKDLISSNIAGSDPENVQLLSEIISFDISFPNEDNYIHVSNNHDANIKVHFPIETTLPNNSIPLCMYRSSINSIHAEWQLDSLIPPTKAQMNRIEYYTCTYNHLSQFAIGLLPPPMVISSSPLYISSTPYKAPSSSPVYVTPSPTPFIHEVERVSNAAQVAGGVVSSFLIILVIVIALVLVAVAIWWRKVKQEKNKVMPTDEIEASDNSVLVERSTGSSSPEPSKITLGVIQLTRSGERHPLGSLDVAKSTRLRELRNLLSEKFPQLKKVSFYLCNKELSDIEPASEQQQFVSIVYGSIAYVREVDSANSNVKRQFCICKKVAQFECSKCLQRGYCSNECQDEDWEANHKRDCSRIVEKRNRSGILEQRKTSTGSIEDELVQVSPRQSVTSWNGFLQQSRSFRAASMRSPTRTTLPPITSQPILPTVNELDENLRQELDSNTQTLVPPSSVRKIPPPATLPRLASRTSIGQLATRPRALSLSPPAPPLAQRTTPIRQMSTASVFSNTQSMTWPAQQRVSIQQQHISPLYNQQPQQVLMSPQPQNIQFPLFTRPSLSTSQVDTPMHHRISVSSIQSNANVLQTPIRQEPILEVDNQSEASSVSSQSSQLNNSESIDEINRPPTLALRKRSSLMRPEEGSDSESSNDSSSDSLSTNSSDDEQ